MISKIKLKIFSNKFNVGIVFKVGIKFDLNFYSLGVTFFLSTL
jgi:hypothetical protein